MANLIQVDYEVLANANSTFTRLAEDIRQMNNDLATRAAALRDGGWWGEGSEAFHSEMENVVIPTLERLYRALEEAGSVTNQVIVKFQETEESTRSGINFLR